MSNRIDGHLRNTRLPSLLLVAVVWGATPMMQAGIPAGTGSGSLMGTTAGSPGEQNSAVSASVPLSGKTTPSAELQTFPAATANTQVLPRYATGGVLYEPTALALDSSGNLWVASYTGGVTEFSPLGELLSPSTGYAGSVLNESYGLTIDKNNHVWVTNEETPSPNYVNSGYGSVTELDASGSVVGSFYGGGTYFPVAVASDTQGRIWVVDDKNMATLLSNSGGAISPSSGYAVGYLAFPDAVAVDANDYAWFANFSSKYITQIDSNGNVLHQVSCCNQTSGLAVDPSGNVWAADYYNNKMSEVSSTGTVLSTGYTGGGLNHPYGVAIDGKGNVWTANYLGNTLSELQGASGSAPGSALSPATGLGVAAGLSLPMALAIDASGNVWVTNFGSNTLTMFVGAAAPAQTPLVGPARLP